MSVGWLVDAFEALNQKIQSIVAIYNSVLPKIRLNLLNTLDANSENDANKFQLQLHSCNVIRNIAILLQFMCVMCVCVFVLQISRLVFLSAMNATKCMDKAERERETVCGLAIVTLYR